MGLNMKTLVRLLLAGLVFATPVPALAQEDDTPKNGCYVLEVPHQAECVIFGQRVVYA